MNKNSIGKLVQISCLLAALVALTNALSIAKCTKNDTGNQYLTTNNGRLRGSCSFVAVNNTNEDYSTNVYRWLSIPYAEAPARFQQSQPSQPWSEELDATKWPNSCHSSEDISSLEKDEQFGGYTMWLTNKKHTNTSENCLFLNMWLPASVYLKLNYTEMASHRAPIMVFLHGTSGTPVLDIYDPSVFVATTGVIAISISYRSGLLGFLHLDDDLSGNQGLYDQYLALKWIYENAEHFGGDKSRITLVGSSNGAASVGYHLMYRESWPYFRNAILQAGSPFHPFAAPITSSEAAYRTREFLQFINCGTAKTPRNELIECISNKPADELVKKANDFTIKMLNGNHKVSFLFKDVFQPVIDGKFIVEMPQEAVENDSFKNCSILTGFAHDEGSMFIAYAGLMGTKITEIKRQILISHHTLAKFLREYFEFFPSVSQKASKLLIDSVLYEYTKIVDAVDHNDSLLLRSNYFNILNRIIGDVGFVCPSLKMADVFAEKHRNVYVYLNNHRLSTSPWPSWYGTVHADELALIFGQPLSGRHATSVISANPWLTYKSKYTQDERALSYDIMNYWASFIKFDDPNKLSEFREPMIKKWPEYIKLNRSARINSSLSENQYLAFRLSGSPTGKNYAIEQCQFWNHLVPNIIEEKRRIEEDAMKNECKANDAAPASINQEKQQPSESNRLNASLALFSSLILFILFFLFC